MVKKLTCCIVALEEIVGVLFLVHVKVDSFHGAAEHAETTEHTDRQSGH